MLVPVVRAAIWPAQMGAVWRGVLSTFSGHLTKTSGGRCSTSFGPCVSDLVVNAPLLLSDAQHKTKCFRLVLNSAIDLHANDAAIGIDIDRA